MFQNFRLLDHLSALDNVALPLRVAGAREGQVREHVAELLSWVGLVSDLRKPPKQVLESNLVRDHEDIGMRPAAVHRPEPAPLPEPAE